MDIRIRNALLNDAEEICKIYRPYVMQTAITFECFPPDKNNIKRRMEDTLKKYPYLVAESDNKIIGYAYADSLKSREAYVWSVETSVYVNCEMRGNGVGKLLYCELEKQLLEIGIKSMYACIAFCQRYDEHLNDGSLRFHEKMNLKKCAHFHNCANKFGKWYDVVWMEKALGEYMNDPPAPNLRNI